MARIQITIDIPKEGPAQVSITSEDNAGVRAAPTARTRGQSASDSGDLRATREARGWTQRELAQRIGCSVGTIALIEQGRKKMSDRLRTKIREAGLVLTGSATDGAGPSSRS